MSASERLQTLGIRLAHTRAGEEQRLPCPSASCALHPSNSRKPALAVRIDDDGHGATWRCHRCGWSGGVGKGDTQQRRESRPNPTGDFALQFWNEAKAIGGTLAEHYLRNARGISGTLPVCLRFHPKCPRGRDERLPTMVALFSDINTSKPVAVHRTFLSPKGGKIEHGEVKMWLGSARGAAIKLTPDEDISQGLALCEGIETGLSLLNAGFPVWALGAAVGIEKFPVLAGIECLTIFADHDEAGMKAARICARRWSDAGHEARILMPPTAGSDWNDFARAA